MAFGITRITNGPCMDLTKEIFELIVDHHSLALLGLRSEEGRRGGVRVKAPELRTRYEP